MPAHRKACPARYRTGACVCKLLRSTTDPYVDMLRKIMAMEPHLKEAELVAGVNGTKYAIDVLRKFGFQIPDYIETSGLAGVYNWLIGFLNSFSPVQGWLATKEEWRPKKEEQVQKPKEVKRKPKVLLVGGMGGGFPKYLKMLEELGWEAVHIAIGKPRSVLIYDLILVAGGPNLVTPIIALCKAENKPYAKNKQFSITWVRTQVRNHCS